MSIRILPFKKQYTHNWTEIFFPAAPLLTSRVFNIIFYFNKVSKKSNINQLRLHENKTILYNKPVKKVNHQSSDVKYYIFVKRGHLNMAFFMYWVNNISISDNLHNMFQKNNKKYIKVE